LGQIQIGIFSENGKSTSVWTIRRWYENSKCTGHVLLDVCSTPDTQRHTFQFQPHVVFVTGDHEYSGEETMPLLAQELEKNYGMKATVLKAYPDQDSETDIPGLEVLAKADLAVFFLRWRQLPASQVAHIRAYLDSGKPVMGFRTSSHSFNYPKGHDLEQWNAFGARLLALRQGGARKVIPTTVMNPVPMYRLFLLQAGHPVLAGRDRPFSRPLVALPGETQLATGRCGMATARQSRQSEQACPGESGSLDVEEQVWRASLLYLSWAPGRLQGGGCAEAGGQRRPLEFGAASARSLERNVQVGCSLSRP
jgi:hypothetical protein